MVQRGHQLRHRRRGRLDPDRRGAHAADHLRPDRRTAPSSTRRVDKLIPQLTDEHYKLDEKTRNVDLTEDGNESSRDRCASRDPARRADALRSREHHARPPRQPGAARAQAVQARQRLHRPRRRGDADRRVHRPHDGGPPLSDGLHQAIEAKEGVHDPARERRRWPPITFQNYFRLYEKLAGMTGTATTEAEEFARDLQAGRRRGPDQPAVSRASTNDDEVYRTAQREIRRRRRRRSRRPHAQGPAGPGRHDQHREIRGAVRRC